MVWDRRGIVRGDADVERFVTRLFCWIWTKRRNEILDSRRSDLDGLVSKKERNLQVGQQYRSIRQPMSSTIRK
jgi:hypothetical protein